MKTAAKEVSKEVSQAIDPICGMTVDPQTAAGTSERDGKTYYFCAQSCKQKFDAGIQKQSAPMMVGITRRGEQEAHDHHHHHAMMHANSAPAPAASDSVDAEEAQEQSYRAMMRKFWFATAVGLPLLLLMFAEVIPAWRHALMPYHSAIGIVSALITLPVLAWSGSQFFAGAWNGFLNHNTNMDTLVALGTGAAWAYSTVVVLAPGLFPAGTAGMYFEVAVIVIALILLGQALEMRAKRRSSAAIRKLLELQAKRARVIRDGREIDVAIEEVLVGD
ncbi:MAG TPA: YHS domain-containing protein, partial [Pyrinomonadaceae bacterium]|nr:YHS domain-containing protein [Pyrinomonadaceae bacterium]